MGAEALAPAFDMEGAFNDVALTLAPGAVEAEVIDATRPRCSPATAGWAPTAATSRSRTASSPTRSRRTASRRRSMPADLPRRRRLPAPHRAVAPGRHAAHGDRPAQGVRLHRRRVGWHYLELALVTVGRGRRARDGARHLRSVGADAACTRDFFRFPGSRSSCGPRVLALACVIRWRRPSPARSGRSARGRAPAAGRSDAAGAAGALPRPACSSASRSPHGCRPRRA